MNPTVELSVRKDQVGGNARWTKLLQSFHLVKICAFGRLMDVSCTHFDESVFNLQLILGNIEKMRNEVVYNRYFPDQI